jgi:peptidoglycan/xylan/chitin deacetylase (PgdA/CDA1 family)
LKKINFEKHLGTLKNIARSSVYPFITSFGIEKVFSALSKNNKLILVYHGVANKPDHNISVGPISTAQFEQHLSYFKKHFNTVSLQDIFEMHRAGFAPKRKTIALTFDDGYENNYTNAYPLLKKYSIPATIFVVAQSVVQPDYITWYDHIYLFQKDLNPALIRTDFLGASPVKSLNELIELCKSLNIEQRDRLFAEIKKHLPEVEYRNLYPKELWKMMDSEQVNELSHSGLIEIGAHSDNHPNLGLIGREYAQKEIVASKQILEKATGKDIVSIAFPDGNYNEEVKKMCYNAGYQNLLAVDYRCASDRTDKNILPRYCISSTSTYESNIIQVNRHFRSYGF